MNSNLNDQQKSRNIGSEKFGTFAKFLVTINFAVIVLLLSSNIKELNENYFYLNLSITLLIGSICALFETFISYTQYQRKLESGDEHLHYYYLGGFTWYVGFMTFLLSIFFLLLYIGLISISLIIYYYLYYNLLYWMKNIAKLIPKAYHAKISLQDDKYQNRYCKKIQRKWVNIKNFFLKISACILIPLFIIFLIILPFILISILLGYLFFQNNTILFLIHSILFYSILFLSTVISSAKVIYLFKKHEREREEI